MLQAFSAVAFQKQTKITGILAINGKHASLVSVLKTTSILLEYLKNEILYYLPYSNFFSLHTGSFSWTVQQKTSSIKIRTKMHHPWAFYQVGSYVFVVFPGGKCFVGDEWLRSFLESNILLLVYTFSYSLSIMLDIWVVSKSSRGVLWGRSDSGISRIKRGSFSLYFFLQFGIHFLHLSSK